MIKIFCLVLFIFFVIFSETSFNGDIIITNELINSLRLLLLDYSGITKNVFLKIVFPTRKEGTYKRIRN